MMLSETIVFSSTDPFDGLELDDDEEEATQEVGEEVKEDVTTCNCVFEAFHRWRPHAWRTAKWLFGLAVLLFTTAVVAGIVEDHIALWMSALAVVCVLFVSAVVACVFACKSMLDDGERPGEGETPANDSGASFA